MERNFFQLLFGFMLVVLFILSGCELKKQSSGSVPAQASKNLSSTEYKILLNPVKFEDFKVGFAEYWQVIQDVAAKEGLVIIPSSNPLKVKQKQISFFDTQDLELLKSGFLLRARTKYDNGEPKPGTEYTIKYVRPSAREALTVDLTLGEGYIPEDDEVELENDIVYFSAENGAEKTNYSLSNSTVTEDEPELTISGFKNMFPVLEKLKLADSTEIKKVAGISAVEWKASPGELEFGHGLKAEMDLSIWILETESGPVNVPEFSFDHGYNKDSDWNQESIDKCKNFMKKLHEANPDWIIPGSGKSARIFGMH